MTIFPSSRFSIYAVRMVLVLLVLVGVLLRLVGTQYVLQWSALQAETLTHGALSIQEVRGSLYGPIHIGALRYQTEQRRIEANGVEIDWAPLSLFMKHIRVMEISVHELRVTELLASAEPLRLPQTLRLPVTLSAPEIRVDKFEFKRADHDLVLTEIRIGAERIAEGYRLALRPLASPLGVLQADVDLEDTPPFAVRVNAGLQQTQGPAYRANAVANGNLSQLDLKVEVQGMGGQAKLQTRVAPLAAWPLEVLTIRVEHMDPALLRKDLPKADLSADIDLSHHGALGFTGNFTLENALSGPWDQLRLPVRKVSGKLAGSLDHVDLQNVLIDLADGGKFEGSGQVDSQQSKLALATARFNPQGVHGKIRPMRLAGDVVLQVSPQDLQLVSNLRDTFYRFHLDARKKQEQIEVRDLTVAAGAGRLKAKGSLDLVGPGKFQIAGTLDSFNPAEFGAYPPARINAVFSSLGQFATAAQASLTFSIKDSRFRQQPLSGDGKLNLSQARLWDVGLRLKLAQTRLEATGALGNPDDRLRFKIDSDNLAVIDAKLGGKGQATGVLEGQFSAPSGQFKLQASKLSWDKAYHLATVHAEGQMGQGVDGILRFASSVQGLVTPQLQLDQASLDAQGTRASHTLQLQARNGSIDLETRLAGAWRDETGWAGQIVALVDRGRYALALKSPVRLDVARGRVVLGNAHIDLAAAALDVHDFSYADGQLATSGEFKRLPLAYLNYFSAQAHGLETDLTLGGRWQVSARKQVDGQISVWREGGDMAYAQGPKMAMGLDRLALDVDAKNSQLQLRLEANGTHLGHFNAEAKSELSFRDGAWGIAADAPLQASSNLTINSLAWLQPLLSNAVIFDGAVNAQLRLDGRFAQPNMSGAVSGDRFAIALPDQGLNFTDGHFKAAFKDQILVLDELQLKGGDGHLGGKGQLTLEQGSPILQLSLQADKLEVLSRPDRLLVLSGKSELGVRGTDVRMSAQIKADRGVIELPKVDTPTLSDDVLVLGRETVPVKKRLPFNLRFNLDVDLGEHFNIKGKGLDAQLGGALTVASQERAPPSSRGSIRVIKGTYSAYGQRLDIERGYLNFQGPLDNPGLNILAMRKNQPVEAGVLVTGTAQSPRVSLVSTPTVPDGQKLSWLVLGHDVEDSSAQEFSVLQAAAGALLDTGDSITLQQRMAQAMGLEEISLKGASGLEGSVLALGKRLSSKAFLTYEQGLTGVNSLVKINYTLSKRISVRVQAGQIPAVDLFYTFSFD